MIGVPFDGMGRSPGQAGAPEALRAAGLPARDVYGIRVAPSQLGVKSLGTSSDCLSVPSPLELTET